MCVHKKNGYTFIKCNRFIFLVDNSIEISNISLNPRDFELTIQLIEIIHYNCNL